MMFKRPRLGIACAVTGVVAGLIGVNGPVASASTLGVVKTVYFNNPLTWQTSQAGAPSAITAAILRLLGGAANAAEVHIAMFEATLEGDPDAAADTHLIEQALVLDLTRGVNIYVVADGHKPHDLWDQVSADLTGNSDAQRRFHVTYCTKSCYQSGTGLMHNKFMIIDQLVLQTSVVDNMVLQMSSNWNYKQLNSHYWNNALEIDDDASLYDGYLAYWSALNSCGSSLAHSCGGAPPSSVQSFSGSSGESVNILPQSSPDPVKVALNGITHCAAGDNANLHTTIDIAVNSWKNDTRGGNSITGILGMLRVLDAAGCPVRIVIPSSAPIASLLTGLDSLSLKTHCTGGGLTAPTEHNKYMLINGSFNSVASQIIFTGSHRFNDESMTQDDEVWMRLLSSTAASNAQNEALFAQYEDNFNEIWNSAPLCSATSLVPNSSDDDSLDP
jgi:hypothetical protein